MLVDHLFNILQGLKIILTLFINKTFEQNFESEDVLKKLSIAGVFAV